MGRATRALLRLSIVLWSAELSSACSSDPLEPTDAGFDTDTDVFVEVVRPVLTPCPEGWLEVPPEVEGGVTTCDPWPGSSPVVMTPCPEGWREVEENGVVACDPWPVGGQQECADDEAHFPGEPGCTPIGTPCPEGNWAEDLPTDREVLYVLAGAPAGGSGTRGDPFGSVAEGLEAAEEGTVVALSKGIFDEAVWLHDGESLWGACVAETVLASSTSTPDLLGTVGVMGRDTVVRNLQIGGQRLGVSINIYRTYSVHLEDVAIINVESAGLRVSYGVATAHNVVIRGTRCREIGEVPGFGLFAEEGAHVELSRAVLERNCEAGINSISGAALTISDVVVRDTASRPHDSRQGYGLQASFEATADVRRAVFAGNREAGFVALHAGTSLHLTDVVVRNTTGRRLDGVGGIGLSVADGASVEVQRGLFVENRRLGIDIHGNGTDAVFHDVVVRDTRSQATTDVATDGLFGGGLQISGGARVAVARAVFERNQHSGVLAAESGTFLSLNDVVIRDTDSQDQDGELGFGLAVQLGAQAEIARILIERNRSIGLNVTYDDTVADLANIVVRDTRGRVVDNLLGRGMEVSRGARVSLSRAVFARNRGFGIGAFFPETSFRLEDVVIEGTDPIECDDEEDCPVYGDGISVNEGSAIEVSRFLAIGNARCGVMINRADLDLHEGEVSENTIGACVRSEEFDPSRLLNDVVFRENGVRLDPNFDMPVPEAALPLGWE